MNDNDMPEPQDFDIAVARAGLVLNETEKERMQAGYAGLKTLLAHVPRDIAMAAEPAVVAMPPRARTTK